MTTHELARLLLSGPDELVVARSGLTITVMTKVTIHHLFGYNDRTWS